MSTHSRIVSLLIITVVIATTVMSAFAETVYPNGLIGNSLTVSITQSAGQVNGCAFARVKKGCTSRVTITIQKKVNEKWISTAYASGEREAGAACTITSGYEYRVYGTLTVYDTSGEEVDRITKYSQSQMF